MLLLLFYTETYHIVTKVPSEDDSLESQYVGCQNLYSFIHNTYYIIVVASLGVLQQIWILAYIQMNNYMPTKAFVCI